ncbi:MAG: translation initiation factor IF-2 [Lachnospiraceae bacterium]
MRVHEYAKSINKESKDLLSILKENGITKTAANSIEDSDIDIISKKLKIGKYEESKQVKTPAPETKAPVKKEENAGDADAKKSDAPVQERKIISQIIKNPENNGSRNDAQRKPVSSVYNPQNSGNNRNDRPYNRDNNGQGRGDRPFNRDNNVAGRGDRPLNRDNNGQGRGDRPFNRDNNVAGRGDRPLNRDNNVAGRGDRPFNRDNNGQGRGDRPFNRDNNVAGRGDRPFNRDNNGQGRGDRPFNRDNNGQGRGDRPFNRDNNGTGRGDRPFNKDQDNRDRNNNRDGRRDFGRGKSDSSADFVFESKPEARKPESRRPDNKNQRDYSMDEKENQKFANSRPGAFNRPKKVEEKPEEDGIKTIVIPDTLTIKDLADKMKLQPSALVKKLFMQGKIVTINQDIDFDTAEEIALEYNCLCEHEKKVDVIAELLKEEDEDEATLVKRPPVVCVMGHVDHGKTSLLDAIRSTNVTARESGGITQHIGAYTVEINGEQITFLDTPGHEAFTAMRMRGAKSTDIAILVVAADDGVMPQTVEAINHAKAAGIEIIVAINKIDKPNANIEKVKQELTEYELIPEDWGGSTIFAPVSAHTKEGIDNLLEMILLVAEMRELKANPNRKARGLVIEAQLDKGRGPVATVLVQKGVLHVGDNVAAGSCHGKIRAMTDDKGNRVKEAGPSTPVEIIGLNDVPNAGEIIMAMDTEKEARTFAETFIREGREKLLDDTKAKLSLDDLFSQIQAGNIKELGIIVKADVQGSVEAVKQSLLKLSNEEVVVKIIHGGVGNINESDVILASASNAIIIGFNVKPDNQARTIAEREKVDLRLYKVIYNAIEDVETAMKGMLAPKYEEKVIGHLVVRQTFKASGVGMIAGAYVSDGHITRDSSVRITRMGELLFEGSLASLKRFKDDVKEVKEGFECGLVFDGFQGAQEDDMIEAYTMVEIPR